MNDKMTLPPFKELYADHWKHLFRVLPNYGIHPNDRADIAQKVWVTVYLKSDSYVQEVHKTPRAWVVGILRRWAANYHREQGHRLEVPARDVGAEEKSPALNPEEMALLSTVKQAIKDEDRCEAFLLRQRNGFTIAEIAAVQGCSEDVVKWRLRMAKKDLNAEKDETKLGAFLGFGSLEALSKALQPGPIPDEVGENLWKQIEQKIRELEADPNGAELNGAEPSVPDVPAPPRSALSGLSGPSGRVARRKLAAVACGSLVLGAAALLAGYAFHLERNRTSATPEIRATNAPAPMIEPSRPAVVDTSRAPKTPTNGPVAAVKARAIGADDSSDGQSRSAWLVAAMRRASAANNFSHVLVLATQHKRQFRDVGDDAVERERLRVLALRHLGRKNEAESVANTAAQRHPPHRAVLERAAQRAIQ